MSPLDLLIAQDWSKPYQARVRQARTEKERWREAGRATLDVLVRRLVRSHGWTRRRTSQNKRDQRADSRYLMAPGRSDYEIRLSNHMFPHGADYSGKHEYIITQQVMTDYNALGLIRLIEHDLRMDRPPMWKGKPAVVNI